MNAELQPAESSPDVREGLVGQNIVCFAKDWKEDPTSCNHVLWELSKRNRVLWVNSISTRAPNLTSGRDLRKIFSRVFGFLRGAQRMGDNMWLFTPFVLPLHHRPWAIKLNRLILRGTLGFVRRKLNMHEFQLWSFMPTSAEYVGRLGENMVVYYCTDEWTGFTAVQGQNVGEMVKSLSQRADVVFATSRLLTDKLQRFNPETHLASHGVKYHAFAQALQPQTQEPADLKALPHPRLGFYGLIEEWLDQDLILHLARRRPEWTIVLIGKVCVDVSKLTGLANVHFLGRKPHGDLPRYCKGLDVALIPHKVNELTRHMNPIKLREYMSAGLPIVSTDLPEMKLFPEACSIARNYDEFEAAVSAALADDSAERRAQRSIAMQDETWDRKVIALGEIVKRVQKNKQ